MKYLFILAFLGATLYASIKTSGIGFDYASATRAERIEWLTYQAEITQSNLNKALRSKHGYNTPFKVTPLSLRGEVYEGYLDSSLIMSRVDANHDRRVLLTMLNVGDENVGRLTDSNDECDRTIAKAAR